MTSCRLIPFVSLRYLIFSRKKLRFRFELDKFASEALRLTLHRGLQSESDYRGRYKDYRGREIVCRGRESHFRGLRGLSEAVRVSVEAVRVLLDVESDYRDR